MNKKAKIIATVGPASNTKQKLKELIAAGADVFRLNFSHGTHEDHQKVIDIINEINEEMGSNICMLQDLQGPKIRIGQVENDGVEIISGENLIISIDEVIGTKDKVSTTYKSLPNDVKPGDVILIDDGKIQVKVLDSIGSDVITEVVYGGILKS
ncbi:MAG: pyruvate kinase, partial [Cyclobacteriaceae bacterium]|nr:pyruvate kinase [Cyclobacteriaceae bacterium]